MLNGYHQSLPTQCKNQVLPAVLHSRKDLGSAELYRYRAKPQISVLCTFRNYNMKSRNVQSMYRIRIIKSGNVQRNGVQSVCAHGLTLYISDFAHENTKCTERTVQSTLYPFTLYI